jgi:hypothetical protein
MKSRNNKTRPNIDPDHSDTDSEEILKNVELKFTFEQSESGTKVSTYNLYNFFAGFFTCSRSCNNAILNENLDNIKIPKFE